MNNQLSNKKFNNIVGREAEQKAKKYLIDYGYRIVRQNYKNMIGEIDFIAYDGDILVFVEVKYRKNDFFGLPREAVNYFKQGKIRRVASSFINRYKLHSKVIRFDVVEILGDEVTIIQDCF